MDQAVQKSRLWESAPSARPLASRIPNCDITAEDAVIATLTWLTEHAEIQELLVRTCANCGFDHAGRAYMFRMVKAQAELELRDAEATAALATGH